MSVDSQARAQALPASGVHALSHCMRTLRSVRQFLPVDVDPASIEFVLWHAVQAGSAKNRQPWRFVVVRDRRTMTALGAWYRRGWQTMANRVREFPDPFTRSAEHRVQMRESELLARLFDTVPVVIVPCFLPITRNPANFYGGASIYPAIQNLLLAARALGLGATLTTIQSLDALPGQEHQRLGDELRSVLEIPANVVPAAVIPLGWPAAAFTSLRRRPVRTVTYAERWGRAWPAEPGPTTELALSGGGRHE